MPAKLQNMSGGVIIMSQRALHSSSYFPANWRFFGCRSKTVPGALTEPEGTYAGASRTRHTRFAQQIYVFLEEQIVQ